MKSPKTKFVVISAIALASTVGILVLAQSPSPSSSPQGLPVHLVMMECTKVDRGKLMTALGSRPKETYKFQYDTDAPVGTLPATSPSPCTADIKLNGNATQKATFANTQELHKFLVDVGL